MGFGRVMNREAVERSGEPGGVVGLPPIEGDKTVSELLSDAESKAGNTCHICGECAHYWIALGERGHFACIEHVQLVIEDVVKWVTGLRLAIVPAASHERGDL